MGFAIFIAFVVLTYLRPLEILAPELEPYRPMIWLSLVALWAGFANAAARKQAAAKSTPMWLMMTLSAVVVLSLAVQLQFGLSASAFTNFAPSIVMFVLTLVNVDSVERLKTTCLAAALSTVILALTGIAAFHTGFLQDVMVMQQAVESALDTPDPAPVGIPAQDTSGRYLWRIMSLGFLRDPNDFAQAMVMALPLLLGLHRRGRAARSVIVVGIPAAIILYAIYLTHSRGAILGLGALLFLAMRRWLGTVASVVLMGVVGIGALAAGIGGSRGFTASEESAGGRIDAWSEGLRMLASNPLLGVGYGRFGDYHPYTAHNSFVLGFSELGLAGYFVWMGILVLAFRSLGLATRSAPKDSEEQRWAGLLRAALVGFLVCAFFLSRTYILNLYLLLALCICTGYCVQRYAKLAPAAAPGKLRWAGLSFFITIATVVLIYAIVRMKYAGLLNM